MQIKFGEQPAVSGLSPQQNAKGETSFFHFRPIKEYEGWRALWDYTPFSYDEEWEQQATEQAAQSEEFGTPDEASDDIVMSPIAEGGDIEGEGENPNDDLEDEPEGSPEHEDGETDGKSEEGGDETPDEDDDDDPGRDGDDFSGDLGEDEEIESGEPDGPYVPPFVPPEVDPKDNWKGTILRTGNHVHREFQSWNDFVTCVDDERLREWTKNYSSHDTDEHHNKGWSGTDTFDEAIDMAARKGWPEGRKLLSDSLALIAPRPEVYKSLLFDVAGAFPLVPMFNAGDPACMVDFGDQQRQAKPIVKIEYNHVANWTIRAEALMLRGAAVVSLANHIEALGHSVEVTIVGVINGRSWFYGDRAKRDPDRFTYSIPVKKAGDYWDLDRAAYALAHPSVLRRLIFALLEQHGDLEASYGSGYGYPGEDEAKPGIICIPSPTARETADTAKAAVYNASRLVLEPEELESAA